MQYMAQKVDSLKRAVVLYHHTRAINLLRCIAILCEKGNGIEATILLRSLLNLIINLKWLIKENSEDRLLRFAEFDAVYKKLTMDALRQYGSFSKSISEGDFSVHDEQFEVLKSKYNLKRDRDLYSWSGTSIRKMAEDVGMTSDYHIVYGYLSKL